MKTLGEADFEALYRSESRKVLATLVRLLGDFDLAEEAMQEAFTTAWDTWMEIREAIYLKCLDIITENGGHIAIPARDLYVQQLPEQIPVSLLQAAAEQQSA